MQSKQTRRDFLGTTLVGGAGLGLRNDQPKVAGAGHDLEEGASPAGSSAPPAAPWMREGIIAASIMESLVFVLRRGGQPADTVKQWMADRSEEAAEKMKNLGVNWVIINFHKGMGLKTEAADIDVARKFTEYAHQRNMKVVGYVGNTLFYETFFKEHPEAKDWMQITEFGRPVYCTRGQTFRYAACRNTPGYRAFIKEVMRVGVQEVKLDGIHFDQMMWWPEPHSCREPQCQEQFRAFLRQRYSDPERLRQRFGMIDLDTVAPPPFDVESGPINLPNLPNPLMQEWALFRARSISLRCGEFAQALREMDPNATLVYNPPMHSLAENVGFVYGVNCQTLFQHGEGIWSEETNLPEWTADGRLVSRIRSYKAARTMGQTLFVWQRYAGGTGAYTNGPVVLRLAESLAYNDANLGVLAGGDAEGVEVSPAIAKYIRFFQAHLKDLTHTKTVADVAVLRAFSSTEFNPAETIFSAILFEQTLIQCKIPFDIVFDRHLKDLGKYKVLVLANQDALSDEQIAAIRSFVQSGGGLVATENSSLMTEWRLPRNQLGLADVFGIASPPAGSTPNTPIRHKFGHGRVVYIPRIEAATPPPRAEMVCTITNDFWKLPKNYVELVESIRWALDDKLAMEVEAPLWVTAELAQQEASNTRLLHLINFRFHEPVESIRVKLRIPEGMQLREVALDSPEGEARRTLTASVQDGVASFQVPQLREYALVLLRMQNKVA